MDSRSHWEKIYGEKAPNAVSWYRPHLETSLSLIERVASTDSANHWRGRRGVHVSWWPAVTRIRERHRSVSKAQLAFFPNVLERWLRISSGPSCNKLCTMRSWFIPETPSPLPLRTNSCIYS